MECVDFEFEGQEYDVEYAGGVFVDNDEFNSICSDGLDILKIESFAGEVIDISTWAKSEKFVEAFQEFLLNLE